MGRQINFYIMREELTPFFDYWNAHDIAFLSDSANFVPHPIERNICHNIQEIQASGSSYGLLCKKEDFPRLCIKQIRPHIFDLCFLKNPVIQMSVGYFDKKKEVLRSARVYYQTHYVKDGEWVKKDEAFIRWAEAFFRWTKRHVVTPFREGDYKGYYASPQALRLHQEDAIVLSLWDTDLQEDKQLQERAERLARKRTLPEGAGA